MVDAVNHLIVVFFFTSKSLLQLLCTKIKSLKKRWKCFLFDRVYISNSWYHLNKSLDVAKYKVCLVWVRMCSTMILQRRSCKVKRSKNEEPKSGEKWKWKMGKKAGEKTEHGCVLRSLSPWERYENFKQLPADFWLERVSLNICFRSLMSELTK